MDGLKTGLGGCGLLHGLCEGRSGPVGAYSLERDRSYAARRSLDDISLTLPKDRNRKVEVRVKIDHPLMDPLAMGTIVSSLEIYDGEKKLASRPLISLEEARAGGGGNVLRTPCISSF
nr:hypothetical protein [Pseudomonas prosekii]